MISYELILILMVSLVYFLRKPCHYLFCYILSALPSRWFNCHSISICSLSELGIPASVDLVSSDPSHMVASFSKGYTSIFNMETQQRILTLESNVDTSMHTNFK